LAELHFKRLQLYEVRMTSVLLFAKKSRHSEALRLDIEALGRQVTMTTSLQRALRALDEPGFEIIIADAQCTTQCQWRELLELAERRQVKILLTALSATPRDRELNKIMPDLDT
jgi:DNA-binding NtrC family response regulator